MAGFVFALYGVCLNLIFVDDIAFGGLIWVLQNWDYFNISITVLMDNAMVPDGDLKRIDNWAG